MRTSTLLVCIASLLGCAPEPQPPVVETPPVNAAAELSPRDHERVRAAVARGEFVPLAGLIEDALRRHPGEVLEVELEGSEYEIEILGADGTILEFEYDARSGELIEVETEDD